MKSMSLDRFFCAKWEMSVISKSACLDLIGPMNAEKANKINQRASSMYDLIYCNQYTFIIHSKLSPFQNSVACEVVCHKWLTLSNSFESDS